MTDRRGSTSRSTGPRSKRGKERSARNAVKHGLNIATSHMDDPLFQEIVAELLALGSGHERTVEASNALLEFRRVMRVYSDRYWETEYKPDEYSPLRFDYSDLVKADGRTATKRDVGCIMSLFTRVQNKELVYGSLEGKRASYVLPLIRYQRASVARLSKSLARR